MILEVVSNSGKVDEDVNTDRLKMSSGTNSGDLKEGRCVHSSGGENHLSLSSDIAYGSARVRGKLNTDGLGVAVGIVEQNAGNSLASGDMEVWAINDGGQVAISGTAPGICVVGQAGGYNRGTSHVAFVRLADDGDAKLLDTVEEVLGLRVVKVPGITDLDGPITTVDFRIGVDLEIVASVIIYIRTERLRLLEVREQVIPAPAVVPEINPGVVVGGRGTGPDHAVDDTSTTDSLAEGKRTVGVVEEGLGDGPPVPVVHGDILETDAARSLHLPSPVVQATGFEDEDSATLLLSEAVGENQARDSASNNHVVVG